MSEPKVTQGRLLRGERNNVDPASPREMAAGREPIAPAAHFAPRAASAGGRRRSGGVGAVLRRLLAVSPRSVIRALSRPDMLLTRLQKPSESSTQEFVEFLFGATPAVGERYRQLHRQFITDHRYFDELNKRMVEKRDRRVWRIRWGELLYVIVRLEEPEVIIETGVFDGISSSVILKALEDNGKGRLYSIDLPARSAIEGSTNRMQENSLPKGCDPGWVVPEYLRARYDLKLGDARVELPRLLDRVGKVDIFLHDSLHTFDHMKWEFETAWPRLRPNGLLLSDDIFWNSAYHDFARAQKRPYCHFHHLGGLRK